MKTEQNHHYRSKFDTKNFYQRVHISIFIYFNLESVQIFPNNTAIAEQYTVQVSVTYMLCMYSRAGAKCHTAEKFLPYHGPYKFIGQMQFSLQTMIETQQLRWISEFHWVWIGRQTCRHIWQKFKTKIWPSLSQTF